MSVQDSCAMLGAIHQEMVQKSRSNFKKDIARADIDRSTNWRGMPRWMKNHIRKCEKWMPGNSNT